MAALHPPPLHIRPRLLNSANPWATDMNDLSKRILEPRYTVLGYVSGVVTLSPGIPAPEAASEQRLFALFNCPNTGAVTTRTSLLKGFKHDDAVHQYAFFDSANNLTRQDSAAKENASINSLGYSPHSLDVYLAWIREISSTLSKAESEMSKKGFIVSVTGSPEDIVECYRTIAAASSPSRGLLVPLAMEINLSCPNIPGSPPPAYDRDTLSEYLRLLLAEVQKQDVPRIPFGLKTPPYTHAAQYQGLIDALLSCVPQGGVCPVSFITATNTLGSCLVLHGSLGASADLNISPALPGFGLGGMAGPPLHPLALGNVATIRRMLDEYQTLLGHIQIIGTGGVSDHAGFERMSSVGAYAVGVGTGLGLRGVKVFADIAR